MPTPVVVIKDRALKDNGIFLARATQICLGLLAVCLAYAAVVSMVNSFRLAREPFQFDYEEGNVLNAGVRINGGLTPYPPPHSWPVVLNPYGPIPYHIVAGLIRSGKPEFFHPRIASLVAALMVAVEIALLAGSFADSVLIGISCGAFFLTLPLVQQWEPLLRVDLIGLAFVLAGLAVFFRLPRLTALAPYLFALAWLCKVTFLAAPVACVVILARRRRWRELGFGILAGLAFLGTCVAALQWQTHGAFLFHQLGTHVDRLSWTTYRTHAFQVLGETSALIALTLVGILRMRRLSDAVIYLIFVMLGTVTGLKVGSESNHFLELEAALCISAAIGFYELQKMKRVPSMAAALVALCALILAVHGMEHRALYRAQRAIEGCPQAYAYIGDHRQILSENVGALILEGKPVLLSNSFVYAQLVRSGKWPSGQVEQMLQEGAADLVVTSNRRLSKERWSDPALNAISANYHLTGRFACSDAVLAYEPNSPKTAPAQ